MGRHDMGPSLRYVSRKFTSAALRRCEYARVTSSMRMTVSGDKMPCAVGHEGSVSHDASTECDSLTLDAAERLLLLLKAVVSLSIC
jgi:hypothetical protein